MKKINWSGICTKNRIEGISELEKIINTHGYILNFNRFSDISLSLMVEIEEKAVDDLYADLANYILMSDFEKTNATSTKDCYVFISITFSKSSGDLIIGVPNIPG